MFIASRKQGRKIAACEILPTWRRDTTNTSLERDNRTRPTTRTTDALQRMSNGVTEFDETREQVFSVYGSVMNVRELPTAGPVYQPVEISTTEHAMSDIREGNDNRIQSISANLPVSRSL